MDACSHCGAVLPAAARFCPTCAAPVAPAQGSTERKLATVIFADLVGSTALAGSQDPERTRAVLERFYDAMAEEIESAGGTVEKFVGDAVMAAFGVPASLEDREMSAATRGHGQPFVVLCRLVSSRDTEQPSPSAWITLRSRSSPSSP